MDSMYREQQMQCTYDRISNVCEFQLSESLFKLPWDGAVSSRLGISSPRPISIISILAASASSDSLALLLENDLQDAPDLIRA